MFGIGETELVLILLFAFMIFGPDKLPGMGKTLGRALRQFRNAQEGFTQVVQTEIVDPATEAMSDKKPNRKREEFDEDADIEGAEDGAPAPKRAETFAERKKRLEAERKAKEAAEKEAAEKTAADDDADADADSAAAGAADAPSEPAEPEAPKKPSVADLYTMKRPSKETSEADATDSTTEKEA
ncbi:Sec-independent protein translocase subunit TatA/TatB [Paratractidigestivibacter sp.]|uniref:Sec-independent protein translocase subunit TatA/TatB n=1 Tax=Paratractidigestivibacter sp. TaxID=2847316 RepID=UPI004029AAE2